MSFVESIKKARESGMSDEQILEAIKKQNPKKEGFFREKEDCGISTTAILDEIIGGGKKEEDPFHQEKLSSEMKIGIPLKPSEETKVWTRIFISFGLIAVAAFSLTLLYRSFFIPKLTPISPETIVREVYIPRATPPLIKLYPEKDDIQRFAITVNEEYLLHLRRIVREEKEGELVRIIAEDQREEVGVPRVINMEDFFNIFRVNFPPKFFEIIKKEYNLFVYTGEATGQLAFTARFDKGMRDDVEWTIMRPWEDTMAESFRGFFSFWDQQFIPDREFLNTTYKGDMPRSYPIRYKEGSGEMGIYYAITEDRLLFATSLDSIKIIIERYHNHN